MAVDMARYFKVIKRIFINTIKADTSFRANFFLNVLQGVIQLVVLIVFFDAIYGNRQIGSWSFNDSLLLIATNQFINAVYYFF